MKLRPQGRIAVAIITLAIAVGTTYLLKKFAPVAEEESREKILPMVEVIAVENSSTSIQIRSQGFIEAPTETSLAAEVGGTITAVPDNFKVGQDFKKNEVLLEIDPADYASALAQLQANVADAELNLALEQGNARRALRNFKSDLLKGEPPSDLALRKPYVKSAEAKLASAEVAVEKAERDLKRTKIRAPYDCRIRATYSEIGSFVTPGARIADIYERGGFEVRLPISLNDYAFIEDSGTGSEVTFSANIAGETKHWKGTIIRDEGVIDRSSRSVYLVASIESDKKDKFLNPGLFVKASISGRELTEVISLPRKALYGKDQIYVIDEKNRLRFRTVGVARTERDRVLITSDLKAGERVCTTNLAAAIDKMKVKILEEKEKKEDEPADSDTAENPVPES
jgi:RND family efflux transporter MFP subunit